MSEAIRKMGIYNAVMAASVQFNSAVFRAVVGVLANVPPSTVAIITAIEFFLNFILEVPTGYLADKYGRIPSAILGHLSVMVGLSCGYTALIMGGQGTLPELLFILHGVFIGFTKPLISGSVDAFYQDAVTREVDKGLHQNGDNSFTLSKAFGKYFTTIAVVGAFSSIYFLHQYGLAHHAFLFGIVLWGIALLRLLFDYRILGDRYSMPSRLPELITKLNSKKVFYATGYNTSVFAVMVVIAGYFLLSIGREFSASARIGDFETWTLMFLFFLGSQGLGWIVKGQVLPKIINKMSPKRYITLFYFCLIVSSVAFCLTFKSLSFYGLCVVTTLYGLIYFTSASAIQAVSRNMLLKEVPRRDYAMSLSIYNMPGFLWVSGYSVYLTKFRSGAPTLEEAFITVSIIAALFLILHQVTMQDFVKNGGPQ